MTELPYQAAWKRTPQTQQLQFLRKYTHSENGELKGIAHVIYGARNNFYLQCRKVTFDSPDKYKQFSRDFFMVDFQAAAEVWNHIWYSLDELKKSFDDKVCNSLNDTIPVEQIQLGQWGWNSYYSPTCFRTVWNLLRIDGINEGDDPSYKYSKGPVITLCGDYLELGSYGASLEGEIFHPVPASIAEEFYKKGELFLEDFWAFMSSYLTPRVTGVVRNSQSFPIDSLKSELYPKRVVKYSKSSSLYSFISTDQYPAEHDIANFKSFGVPLSYWERWNVMETTPFKMEINEVLQPTGNIFELFAYPRCRPIIEDLYSKAGLPVPKKIKKFDPEDEDTRPLCASKESARAIFDRFRELSDDIGAYVSEIMGNGFTKIGSEESIKTGCCYWFRDALSPSGPRFHAFRVRKIEKDSILVKLKGQIVSYTTNRLDIKKDGTIEAIRSDMVAFPPEEFCRLKEMAETALQTITELFNNMEFEA